MTENRNQSGSGSVPAVVVGVDGSPGAAAALRWAVAEARLRNAPLRAIHAWTVGYVAGLVEGFPQPDPADQTARQRAAEDLLDRAISDVGVETEGVEVERQVIEGDAAEALMRAAGPGDLLVVGSGGHEVVTDLLLGSVSQRCVHHAACPVVVVHPSSPPARDDLVVEAEIESSATRAEGEDAHDDERDRDEADREGIAEDNRLERAIGHSDEG